MVRRQLQGTLQACGRELRPGCRRSVQLVGHSQASVIAQSFDISPSVAGCICSHVFCVCGMHESTVCRDCPEHANTL
eukprot:456386-Prymnesium_polylepis.1